MSKRIHTLAEAKVAIEEQVAIFNGLAKKARFKADRATHLAQVAGLRKALRILDSLEENQTYQSGVSAEEMGKMIEEKLIQLLEDISDG